MTVTKELINQFHHCEYCDNCYKKRCSKCTIIEQSGCPCMTVNEDSSVDYWTMANDIDVRLELVNEYGFQELMKYLGDKYNGL